MPRKFFASAESPDGASLDDLLKEQQSTTSRTPSAFAAAKLTLKPGESKTIALPPLTTPPPYILLPLHPFTSP